MLNGYSRNGQILRYQRTASLAIRFEINEQWIEANETWNYAARIAPQSRWQMFSRERAKKCKHRYKR